MDIFKLAGTIAINGAKEAQNEISDISDKAQKFESKLKDGIKTVAKWGTAIVTGATAAATSLVKFATSSASVADNVDKMSQKIGISRQAYQELDFICSQSGASVDGLQMGMKTLTAAMDKAAAGTASNVEMFAKLGVTVTNTDGTLRSQEEVMWETLSALQKMENQTEKARLATELFGRSGTELMPLLNGAAGSIEEMKNQAHELGLVLDDETIDSGVKLTDTMDQLKRATKAVITETGAKLMPVVQKLAEYIIKKLPDISKTAENLGNILANLFMSLEPLLEAFINDILPAILSGLERVLPVVSDIASVVLPILISAIEFLVENFSSIITVIGVAVAAFKTMQIIKTVTSALDGASSAMEVFNTVLKSNPIGMVVTAVGALALALGGLASMLSDDIAEMDAYTRESHEMLMQSIETENSYRELTKAIYEKRDAQLAEIDNTQALLDELKTLVDENGNVKEGYEDRVAFITGKLSEATGVEIELVDGQIQKYEDLIDTIQGAIDKKKAEILLQASEEAYSNAIQKYKEQEIAATKAYDAYLKASSDAKKVLAEKDKLVEESKTSAYNAERQRRIESLEEEYKHLVGTLSDTRAAYNTEKDTLSEYYSDIQSYEKAYAASMEGDYDKVNEILLDNGKTFLKAADIVGEATEQERAAFKQQMDEAEAKYNMMRENYLKGAKGFTYDMVAEARNQYNVAKAEYQKVGEAMVNSMINSANDKGGALGGVIQGIVKSGISAGLSAAKSVSTGGQANTWTYTARKHAKGGIVKKGEMAFLEGEGTEAVVPLEKNTEWIGKVADQFTTAINVRQPEPVSVATPSLAEKFDSLANKFDNLIDLLQNQRIYLDNDVLVGELTPAFDTSLGEVYSRKARGN